MRQNRVFRALSMPQAGVPAPFWSPCRGGLRHSGASSGVRCPRPSTTTSIEDHAMDFRIDDLARRLLESVPPAVRGMQQDLESNFRAVLRANLARLDLVARDEFTAQSRVLERTRTRLEALERRIAELESRLPPGSAG
jgi:BMFP domain-containing protein YqiC